MNLNTFLHIECHKFLIDSLDRFSIQLVIYEIVCGFTKIDGMEIGNEEIHLGELDKSSRIFFAFLLWSCFITTFAWIFDN